MIDFIHIGKTKADGATFCKLNILFQQTLICSRCMGPSFNELWVYGSLLWVYGSLLS